MNGYLILWRYYHRILFYFSNIIVWYPFLKSFHPNRFVSSLYGAAITTFSTTKEIEKDLTLALLRTFKSSEQIC